MNQEKPYWWPDAQGFVAGAVIFIIGAALFYRMINPSTVEDKVLDMMLTILFGTAFVAIINFLFGSSRSSQSKDETIATLAVMPADGPLQPASPKPSVNNGVQS